MDSLKDIEEGLQDAYLEKAKEIHQKVKELLQHHTNLKTELEELVLYYFDAGIEFGGMQERLMRSHKYDLLSQLINCVNENNEQL